MPPIRSLKCLDSEYQEGRIQLVLNVYSKGEISSLRAAAAFFNVLLTTLSRRYKDIRQHATTRLSVHKLIQLEKDLFIEWVISMDLRGFVSKCYTTRDMVNLLLVKTRRYCISADWSQLGRLLYCMYINIYFIIIPLL